MLNSFSTFTFLSFENFWNCLNTFLIIFVHFLNVFDILIDETFLFLQDVFTILFLLTTLTVWLLIYRRNISLVLLRYFWLLSQWPLGRTQLTMILKKRACCRNNVIRIQFNHLSVRQFLFLKTCVSLLASIFVVCWRNIYRKTLVAQIRIVRSCSELHIVVFGVAVNWHHALTVFVWIPGIARASNGYWIVFLLIKVRDIHLSVIGLFNRLGSIVSTLGPRSSQALILRDLKRIRNDLDRLLCPLVVCPVEQATLVRRIVWNLTFIK